MTDNELVRIFFVHRDKKRLVDTGVNITLKRYKEQTFMTTLEYVLNNTHNEKRKFYYLACSVTGDIEHAAIMDLNELAKIRAKEALEKLKDER